MWNIKYGTNEPVYEIETDLEREQACGCQVESRKKGVLEVWGW